MNRNFITAILYFGFIFIGGSFAQTAAAATRTVDNITDNGALTACTAAANDCSLRGAVTGAAAGDTINFDAALTNATITLAGEIPLVRNITINGLGADKLTISGGGTNRLFSYMGGATLNFNFSGLTLTGGNGVGATNTNQGGVLQINGGATTATFDAMVFRNNSASALAGVLLFAGGSCRISNSTFTNNSAPQATVIYFISGSLQIANSTFSGNSGSLGIVYSFGNQVIVRNATIVNNPGGGLYKDSGTITLGNTIVAGNGSYDLSRNGGSAINTNGGNLIGRNNNAGPNFSVAGTPNINSDYVGTPASPIDPLLLPLGNYGGTTPTYAPQPGSLAINRGNNCVVNNSCVPAMAAALTTDQRGAGFVRQFGTANVDIGAFETQVAPTSAAVLVGGRVFAPDGRGLKNARVILTDSQGNTRTTLSTSFGYFRFDGVEIGQTYILSVSSKAYIFEPQLVQVFEEITELNLIAQED
jgi:hypothetical protein